jgi:hypothetical protein
MQVDYTVWRENFGATSGSGAAMSQPLESVVPEPAGATLMLGALTAFSVLFLDPRCRAS